MDLRGTRTEANLLAAFAGESQARNKYTYFASVASKAGHEQIAEAFLRTAEQEREHAKLFLRTLGGLRGDTPANLLTAAKGENEEWTSLYPQFAQVARDEGFALVARLFDGIAAIEKRHEQEYRELSQQLADGTLYQKPEPVRWVCRNCGHVHEGPEAPGVCPVCNHPQGFFQVL